jgi:dihydrofolate reductase
VVVNAIVRPDLEGSMPRLTVFNHVTLDGCIADRNGDMEPGEDMAILGSGSIVAQLAPAGLIDEYQVMLNPVALGGGKSMFAGASPALTLTLTRSRVFRNGNVLLVYEPVTPAA